MLLNLSILKYHKISLLCVLMSCVLYFSFAYNLIRTEATKLILLYSSLFIIAYILNKRAGFQFRFLVASAILLRLIFLLATPNLSQDFYRFIWDGRLLFEGFNPYLYTPDAFIQNGEFPVEQAIELYNGMGALSASHFTNYPPINQFCFYLAAFFSGKSVTGAILTMRVIIIAADIGVLYFGKKLLKALKLPLKHIWFYMLNPLVIIELTGNLHFEGVMIFFLIWSLYLLHTGKWKWAAVVFACSISVKLMPLMFLPVFFWWFSKRNSETKILKNNDLVKSDSDSVSAGIIKKHKNSHVRSLYSTRLKRTKLKEISFGKIIMFYTIVLGVTLLLFLPFFSMEFITNYSKTIGLWFNNFEFNASIYYLAREVGYAITGYNEIKLIGKILPIITILIILYFSLFKKNNRAIQLINSILLVFTCYLFLSTTVHPWYIVTLVALCIFTDYRYPIVWSFVIILSYVSYLSTGTADKSESLWVIAIEYTIVFGAFIYEVVLRKRLKIYSSKSSGAFTASGSSSSKSS